MAITIVGQILGLLIIRRENERIVGSWKFLRIHDQYIGVHQMDNHIEKMITFLFIFNTAFIGNIYFPSIKFFIFIYMLRAKHINL